MIVHLVSVEVQFIANIARRSLGALLPYRRNN